MKKFDQKISFFFFLKKKISLNIKKKFLLHFNFFFFFFSEIIQQKVRELGGIGKLVELLTNKNEMVLGLTLRAICNLSDEVENRKQVEKEGGLEKIIIILKENETENVLNEVVTTLSALSTDDSISLKLVELKIIEEILNKVCSSNEDTLEQNKSLVRLLVSFSEKDFVALHFLKVGTISLLLQKFRDEKIHIEIREQIAKSVSLLGNLFFFFKILFYIFLFLFIIIYFCIKKNSVE